MEGDCLIVSARWDDDVAPDAGAVYVYRLANSGESWTFEAKLHASSALPHLDFGSCVDIAGDVLVVGASGVLGVDSDCAFVFRRTPVGTWQEETVLLSPSKETTRFGFAACTNGQTVFVSGYCASGYSKLDQWIDVFAPSEATNAWTHVQRIDGPTDQPGQTYAATLDADGNTLIAGSGRFDKPLEELQACAYVYEPDSDSGHSKWGLQATLIAGPLGLPGVWLTKWCAIHQDTIALGLPFPAGGSAGQVAVFQRDAQLPAGWRRVSTVVPGTVDPDVRSGFSVGLSSENLLIGGPRLGGASLTTATGPGRVFFVDVAGADCNSNNVCDNADIAAGASHDRNANGIPDECECFADANGDGAIDVTDLLAVVLAWGACPAPPTSCAGDVAPWPDGDDLVNVTDLLLVIGRWGPCP